MPGVLAYTIINDETYFLLGKERGGKDKDTWCMLSGGKESKDISNKMAACREAHEESAGLLGKTDEIAQRVFSLNGSDQTYLLEVKNPGELTNEKFLAARAKYKDPHYREMTEIKWMKTSELVDVCVNNMGVFSMNGQTERIRPFVSKTIAANAEYIKSNKFLQDNPFALEQKIADVAKAPLNNKIEEKKSVGIEIYSISQINTQDLNKDTLVLFDVDETLLIDKDHMRKNIDRKHLGHKQYIPIENNSASMIETIKKINEDKTVLGLTKRAYSPHNSADKQIQELNIPFSRWRFKQLNAKKHTHKACFNNGVIYTAGDDKGKHLGYFLNKSGYKPKNVVMVDDREDNLIAVNNYCRANNISVTLYLMKGADQFNLQNAATG